MHVCAYVYHNIKGVPTVLQYAVHEERRHISYIVFLKPISLIASIWCASKNKFVPVLNLASRHGKICGLTYSPTLPLLYPWIGSWVNPVVGLEAVEKEKYVLSPVVRPVV
jgi:hypothetical protein